MKQIEISANDAGQRLDRFLKKYLCRAPLSGIYRIIRKDLKLNGRRAKEDIILSAGDVLSFYLMDEELEKLSEKRNRPHIRRSFSVAYEDDDILVVNKPCGLLVHGAATEKKNTLSNQVIDYLIEKGDYVPRLEKSFSPAPAHRLDRNTTGLVAFGKTTAAQKLLASAFAGKAGAPGVRKFYKTLCRGRIDRELELEGYLIKDEKTNTVRVSKTECLGGRFIKTLVRPLLFNYKCSLVEVELITGRTHQIRAHLASIGHPVIGDPKYGSQRSFGAGRDSYAQYLHAATLIINGKTINSELPDEFRLKAEELFGKDRADEIK